MSLPNARASWHEGERPGAPLSPQQRRIYRLTLRGWSTSRIADVLGCTPSSVSQQRLRVAAKLGIPRGVRSRTHKAQRAAILLAGAA